MTTKRILGSMFRWAAVLGLIAAACACSPSSSSKSGSLGRLDGDDSFPSEQLTDWISYAQQIALVKVIADRELAMPADEKARGEGYQGRSATLVVERNLWIASGFTPRRSIQMVVAGWTVHDHTRTEVAMEDSPRIEVGDELVVPFTQYDDGSVAILSGHAVVPVSGKLRGLPALHVDAAVTALRGRSPEQMAAILAATPADPLAKQYATLPPYSRARKVTQIEQSAIEPTDPPGSH